MGRRKVRGSGSLGRALIRHQTQRSRGHRHTDSWLHTSDLSDGYDWGRLNLQSVTEQSSLDDFLATAELAGTEFVAEKLNIKFVLPEARTGLLSFEESQRIQKLHEENRQFLSIPRRPVWDKKTSPEELKQAEKDNFLKWRRQLVRLEEEEKLILTPFERNLDFWRQFWRVIERSDIVVQIVDARNPLLFRCEDLECYVKEIDPSKENVILINKADLLTAEQRGAWAAYFEKEGVQVIFWSALAGTAQLNGASKEPGTSDAGEASTAESEDSCSEEDAASPGQPGPPPCSEAASEDDSEYEDCREDEEEEEEDWRTCSEEGSDAEEEACEEACHHDWRESPADPGAAGGEALRRRQPRNLSRLVSKQELLELFKQLHTGRRVKAAQLTVGLVGYPNVGKSSTINTILGNKKVSVSATPGHTKHFQTLYVEPGLCLCDCPGLVMPSFVSTKAEMTCSGILPIDQMRDHVPPVSLVCQNIPRRVLEATYGISLTKPREDEDPHRPPTAEELLTAYGSMRGFMTAHGQPDEPRSARYILKDYVRGKLLHCHPPPGIDPVMFQYQHRRTLENNMNSAEIMRPSRTKKEKQIENVVDKTFFHQENVRALTRGVQAVMGYQPGSGRVTSTTVSSENMAGKPWKKHGNRNKKEKSRRLYKHLDM
ncbi:PREDICTED: large subunit GTPase 1 homolog [Chinchilla lanigera]|uniref:large subunit GTPase 1 homolog n=1 Tax=Chinchilla lanigera TaxID=34839 RepID=UPI0006981E82|nr:PREDICTED: large subunit GTPase 1 homolog [Chinchilla lanigera]